MVTKKSSHPVTQKRKVTSAPVTQKGKVTRSQKAQQDLAQEKLIREESIQPHSVSVATSTNETSSLKEQLAKKDEELKRLREKMEQWETETTTQKSAISKKTVCVKLHSEGTSSKLSRMTVDMTQDLQKKLNVSMVGYIKDKWYSEVKFVRNNVWADGITAGALKNEYLSLPIGWTKHEFTEHMRAEIYKCYGRIRHNSQSMARKRFLGKLGYVVNLGLLGYVANLRLLKYAVNLGS
jgi:predicted  nucleic acid-binding Zn-ribbon protein